MLLIGSIYICPSALWSPSITNFRPGRTVLKQGNGTVSSMLKKAIRRTLKTGICIEIVQYHWHAMAKYFQINFIQTSTGTTSESSGIAFTIEEPWEILREPVLKVSYIVKYHGHQAWYYSYEIYSTEQNSGSHGHNKYHTEPRKRTDVYFLSKYVCARVCSCAECVYSGRWRHASHSTPDSKSIKGGLARPEVIFPMVKYVLIQ